MYSLEMLTPVFTYLFERYTKKEISSISYDEARTLMHAIMYILEEDDPKYKLADTTLLSSEGSIVALYKQCLVKKEEKFEETKRMYEALTEWFNAYGNQALEDTVVKGFPAFFLYYDMIFEPQDTILTLDYPLLIQRSKKYSGIDLIHTYLENITIEQVFLMSFEQDLVLNTCQSYDLDYKVLIFNLCEPLISNAVACFLLGKLTYQYEFTVKDLRELEVLIVDTQDLEMCVEKGIAKVLELKNLATPDYIDYFCKYAKRLASDYRTYRANNCLQTIFKLKEE